ncbi:MAG: hypothetical protein GY943_08840 [Chloroflexi bacterium]|nr:hypothetical protein [Chloroflexota bacterium]
MTIRRLFVWLFAIALFTMAVRETLDPDMWWHLRTGEYILQNGIPHQDVFSFTVPHHEWITHEWLSQLFMWGVYLIGGLPALIVAFAGLVALSFWLVYAGSVGRPYLAGFVLLPAAFASAIVWGSRPQIFNLLLTAVFIFIVERYRQGRIRIWVVWLLPVLTALWANLHSGYLLGVVLLGTYTVGAALDRWFSAEAEDGLLSWVGIRRLAVVTAVSFLAAALNPNGVELWIYPFLTLGSTAMQVYIQEWHSPDFHQSFFWPFAFMLGLGVLSWVYSRKRPSWTDMLLFLGTGAAGLLSARHIPLFALVSIPIVSRHLFDALKDGKFASIVREESPTEPPKRVFILLNWSILVAALFVSFVWTANKIIGNEEAVAAAYPVTAVDFLESEGLADQPGYNSYNWGGYLIWRGIPVFVDGRADVYGDEFLFYYLQAFEARSNWTEPLDEFDIAYVMMERGSSLNSILLATGDWQDVYSDDIAQIFVRLSP